jgi:septum formation protein
VTSATPDLVLASTSPYRAELLARLRLPFGVERPQVDETPAAGEPPATLALRLAAAKAAAVARRMPGAVVIGSDQVASFDGRAIGKPGSRAAAIAQLQAMSGREVSFLTAVAVAGAGSAGLQALDTTVVRFRPLDEDTIARYVDAEQPFDCAGSFRCEGLGIALFEAIDTRDPTALVGLPLIATARLLREVGFVLP